MTKDVFMEDVIKDCVNVIPLGKDPLATLVCSFPLFYLLISIFIFFYSFL